MNNKKKYFQFPLFLLQGLFDDPDHVLNQIFLYGFMNYASKKNYTKDIIAERIIYAFYRKDLCDSIKMSLEEYILEKRFTPDFEQAGFRGYRNFEPFANIRELMDIFDRDYEFYLMCHEFAQREYALFNIQEDVHGEYKNLLDELYKSAVWEEVENINIPCKEPMPNVEVGLLLSFINRKKTETDLVQFAGYLAVNSIIGKKKHTERPTNMEHVLARMFGYKSKDAVPDRKHPLHERYLKRYHFNKLKFWLQDNWHVNFYSASGVRGFYLANKGIKTIDDLALLAETNKTSNKMKQMIVQNRLARLEAKKQIGKLYNTLINSQN